MVKKLNIRLKEIRINKGLSIRELSKLSTISRSEISGVENGTIMPTIYVICCLAKSLEVDLENLVDYS